MKLARAIPSLSGIADPRTRQVLDALRVNLLAVTAATGNRTTLTVTSPQPGAGENETEPISGAAQAEVSAPANFVNIDGGVGGLSVSNPPTQSEVLAIRNAAEVLADDCRGLRETVAAYQILISELRRALIEQRIITGGA
jgi:hypothetical protein